jgi:hypothetical protein
MAVLQRSSLLFFFLVYKLHFYGFKFWVTETKGGSMTIGNALGIIKQGLGDKNLRKELNRASSVSEVYQILAREHFAFSFQDFDQAHYLQLVKCQEIEQAQQLKEFKLWWDLLLLSMTAHPDGNHLENSIPARMA